MPRWEPDAEAFRKAVHWALLDAWNATRPNAHTPPPDITRRTGNTLRFEPGAWADKTAQLLIQRGLRLEENKVDGTAIQPTRE